MRVWVAREEGGRVRQTDRQTDRQRASERVSERASDSERESMGERETAHHTVQAGHGGGNARGVDEAREVAADERLHGPAREDGKEKLRDHGGEDHEEEQANERRLACPHRRQGDLVYPPASLQKFQVKAVLLVFDAQLPLDLALRRKDHNWWVRGAAGGKYVHEVGCVGKPCPPAAVMCGAHAGRRGAGEGEASDKLLCGHLACGSLFARAALVCLSI